MSIRTRYGLQVANTIDAETIAFCGINSKLAEFFNGKCYHYINDLYGEASNIKKTAKYLDRFFPDTVKNVRCFRANELEDIREAAIVLIKNGEAVIYNDTSSRQNDEWEKLSPDEQVKIATGNDKIGIRLKSNPFEVTIDDPVQGPINIKIPTSQTAITLFYPVGKPSALWANVYDDSILEITHSIRERKHAILTCQEIALHIANGSSPPQFIHLDIQPHQVGGLDPFRISTHMPINLILDAIWEHMTIPNWKKTINDMGFLCEPKKPLSTTEINIKIIDLIVKEINDPKRVDYLRVFFDAAEPQDLLRFARFINPNEGWDWSTIQDFITNALDGPGHMLNDVPIMTDKEALNMSAVVTCLDKIEFTTNDLNRLMIEFATTLGMHVQKLDRFLMFGCFGRKLPLANIYPAMCELGKHECIKRLRVAEKLIIPNYSIRG